MFKVIDLLLEEIKSRVRQIDILHKYASMEVG